jgi:O-antigen ligase
MKKATPAMRLYSVAAAYALWILGIFVVFYLVHAKDENALQLVVMCGAIPAGLQLVVLGVDWRGLTAPIKIWIALVLVILVSYLVNGMDPQTAPSAVQGLTIPAAWTPIVYTLNTVFVLGIATLVAGCPDRRLLRSIAGLYCVFATPFLVYIDLFGERVWGRLSAGLESTNWGLMAITVCVAAFSRKPGPLAVAGFVSGVATILFASSREDLVALAVILLAVIILDFRAMSRPRLFGLLAGSCLALVLVAVLLDPYVMDAVGYVKHDVFLVDSADRGIDSGFTGRSAVWAETVDLWLRHPFFGVGFRQHEHFLAGLPAHNGYLAMLADTGVPGLIVYLVLLISSLVASWSIQDQRTRRFVMAAIVGYVVVGFFDRRAINAGNPYGVFFLLCCSVALVDQSLRKADELRQRALGTTRDVPSVDSALPAR